MQPLKAKGHKTPHAVNVPRRRIVAIGLAIGLSIASGWLHGSVSQRWFDEARFEEASQRLAAIPDQFGAWQQTETLKLGKSAMQLLSCRGYIHRTYRHRITGEEIRVAVMVGPGSKMSIHIPEICYEASNFTLLESRQLVQVPGNSQDAWWGVRFRLNDVTQQELRVVYGWSTGGLWLAPRYPRWSVASAPLLYKLQMSCVEGIDRAAASAEVPQDTSREFLRAFLPILQSALHGDQPARTTTASVTRHGDRSL